MENAVSFVISSDNVCKIAWYRLRFCQMSNFLTMDETLNFRWKCLRNPKLKVVERGQKDKKKNHIEPYRFFPIKIINNILQQNLQIVL